VESPFPLVRGMVAIRGRRIYTDAWETGSARGYAPECIERVKIFTLSNVPKY